MSEGSPDPAEVTGPAERIETALAEGHEIMASPIPPEAVVPRWRLLGFRLGWREPGLVERFQTTENQLRVVAWEAERLVDYQGRVATLRLQVDRLRRATRQRERVLTSRLRRFRIRNWWRENWEMLAAAWAFVLLLAGLWFAWQRYDELMASARSTLDWMRQLLGVP